MLEAFICLPNLWEIMPAFYRIQDRFSSLTTTEFRPQNVEEFRSKYGQIRTYEAANYDGRTFETS